MLERFRSKISCESVGLGSQCKEVFGFGLLQFDVGLYTIKASKR